MKTTIDIPDEALQEAMEYLGTTTKREAVLAALEEFNRRHRMAALVDLSGTCDFDTNDEIEATEAQEATGNP
jgi:Arc/MetJ family transcription regulator